MEWDIYIISMFLHERLIHDKEKELLYSREALQIPLQSNDPNQHHH
jgi:hypothetical protein